MKEKKIIPTILVERFIRKWYYHDDIRILLYFFIATHRKHDISFKSLKNHFKLLDYKITRHRVRKSLERLQERDYIKVIRLLFAAPSISSVSRSRRRASRGQSPPAARTGARNW
ncbi:MAG: hypothetical protein ACOC4M_18095 [Promethearchaeia archaeon]